MAFNIINNNMKVHSKIELLPEINYVSASNDCNFLNRLDIDIIDGSGNKIAGEYGAIKRFNQDSNDERVQVYFINNSKFKSFQSDSNTIQKITKVKADILSVSNLVQDAFSTVNTGSYTPEEVSLHLNLLEASKLQFEKKSYVNAGLQKKYLNNKSFGVERIKSEFVIDSPGYNKKRAILNNLSFYKEKIKYKNFHDISLGFRNFNCINFFNIDETLNSNFEDNKTHKNCIVFPNLVKTNSTNQTYDFTDIKDFSVSFYINPKRKNKSGFHYNPGCIIDIPGIISVFIIKGSSTDEDGLINRYRLFVQSGSDSYSTLNNILVSPNFDLSNSSSQNHNLNYLSKDNLLSFNNWHNVCLSFKKSKVGNNNFYDMTIYLDGVLIDSFVSDINISNLSGNSFISIGNKFEGSFNDPNNLSNFIFYTFSRDKSSVDDNEGPYVNKHILFGDHFESVLNTPASPGTTFNLKNTLNAVISDYIDENTSLALNAELYDIRVYSEFLDSNRAKNIFEKGVSSLSSEMSDGLIFYLPAYYYSQKVRKKGLVNLFAPYQKYFPGDDSGLAGSSPILGTMNENLSGVYFFDNKPLDSNTHPHETPFSIKKQNISYNYPINPIFYNFTGGTDVSVEHFLREFVSNTQPNIVIGSDIIEDNYQNCFLVKTSKIVEDNATIAYNTINETIKKGGTPDDLLNEIMTGLSEDDINDLHIDHQHNNISYRNYMILPCDNGLQEQFYNEDVFLYNDESSKLIHTDSLGVLDFGFVSLDRIDNTFQRDKNTTLRSSTLLSSNDDERIFDINNRVLYAIGIGSSAGTQAEVINIPEFIEYQDRLKNISLSNYHSQQSIAYVNEADLNNVTFISRFRQTAIDVSTQEYSGETINPSLHSTSGFFRTLSNPAQRSYYSSHLNAISNSEIYDYKKLDDSNNLGYKKISAPLWYVEPNNYENVTTIFSLSTQLFNKEIKRETFSIKDVDMPNSCGLQLEFKDSKLGTLYRCDSLTKPAEWNTSGNIIYNEGIAILKHPCTFNYGKNNVSIKANTFANANIFELNLPAHSGNENESKNISKIDNLRLDNSAFNSDEDFVYITDIDLHDENLNIIASVKLAQPFAKKDSDNALFRVKMDY